MDPHQHRSFIILGITATGTRFRPSDWAERLAGTMSVIRPDRRMIYSPHVQPGSHDGHPCVFVDARIHGVEPLAYAFLENFARDNELQVLPWPERDG